MDNERIHSIAGKVAFGLTFAALLAVLSGYTHKPSPDEGAAAHIFQLAVLALVPTTALFFATIDWKRPVRSARSLAIPIGMLMAAFAALYYLEHYR